MYVWIQKQIGWHRQKNNKALKSTHLIIAPLKKLYFISCDIRLKRILSTHCDVVVVEEEIMINNKKTILKPINSALSIYMFFMHVEIWRSYIGFYCSSIVLFLFSARSCSIIISASQSFIFMYLLLVRIYLLLTTESQPTTSHQKRNFKSKSEKETLLYEL